jgi:hypothetical protein
LSHAPQASETKADVYPKTTHTKYKQHLQHTHLSIKIDRLKVHPMDHVSIKQACKLTSALALFYFGFTVYFVIFKTLIND